MTDKALPWQRQMDASSTAVVSLEIQSVTLSNEYSSCVRIANPLPNRAITPATLASSMTGLLRPVADQCQRPLRGDRSDPGGRSCNAGLAPVSAPQYWDHFLLRGTPYSLQTSKHHSDRHATGAHPEGSARSANTKTPRQMKDRIERLPRIARQLWGPSNGRFHLTGVGHWRRRVGSPWAALVGRLSMRRTV